MTWAVYDNTTNIITRLDNSEYPPEGETYIELSQPMLLWPSIPQYSTWKVVDGQPVFVDPRTQEQILTDQWTLIRTHRDQLLQKSDWRVIKSVDTGIPVSEAWKAYRQALRNITQQLDPFNITWPEAPTI